MKRYQILSLALLTTLIGCSGAEEPGFKGDVVKQNIPKAQNAEPEAPVDQGDDQIASVPEPVVQADLAEAPSIEAAAEVQLSLEVRVPVNVVRAGAEKVQAEAVLSSPVDSKIIWSIEGAANVDLGKIDESGKYTSPAKAGEPIDVVIVATLEADPSVVGKKPLKIIPAEQLFVGCQKGSVMFPISAHVYQLPPETSMLPDFSKMDHDDIVCLDKFDIKPQSWEAGFPGATNLQEWFGLRAKAKIIIPQTGSYTFKLLSDDGSILSINGAVVINHDGKHSPTEKVGAPIELTLGKHELNLDYFQGPRTHVALQLFWKVPGSSSFTIVPASAFSEK